MKWEQFKPGEAAETNRVEAKPQESLENPDKVFETLLAEARKNARPESTNVTGQSIRNLRYHIDDYLKDIKNNPAYKKEDPAEHKRYLQELAVRLATKEAGLNQRLEKMSPADRETYLAKRALAEENIQRSYNSRSRHALEIDMIDYREPNREKIKERLLDAIQQDKAAVYRYHTEANELDEMLPRVEE